MGGWGGTTGEIDVSPTRLRVVASSEPLSELRDGESEEEAELGEGVMNPEDGC